ncbi:hypothetical protein [Saccharopolyspora pogona]|uniref:hypothetical protein n=1 Tax=Saccharopolyspora pogona TaxID=333966 RepID=UPI0016826C5E|nr:hypothetical protein [Saccharopolyspora pogona]
MLPLDDRTAERIAEVIVDVGGPYERKGYDLEKLLARANWVQPPEYDGSPRVPWLAEQLIERKHASPEIERLLCRVCDPVEYDDGKVSADEFREVINSKLEAEQLVVSIVGGRPVLGELGADGDTHYSAPGDLEKRLQRLIRDRATIDGLLNRVHETGLCERSGAHTMAIIGIGSFVEGLLLALFLERDAQIREHGFAGRKASTRADRAGLALLIDTAHDKGWIQLDAKDFMHNVREYRNFVHPAAELREKPKFDRDSVTLCWAPVRALLNDLEESIPAIGG